MANEDDSEAPFGGGGGSTGFGNDSRGETRTTARDDRVPARSDEWERTTENATESSGGARRVIHPAIRRIGLGLLVWILASVALLEAIDLLSYERVFVASLIGFLALRELVSPRNVPSRWRTRLNWILAAGLVAFAILIGRQILTLV